MTVVILLEAVAIAVLGVLACGLLRSQTQVLQALEGLGAGTARRRRGSSGPTPVTLQVSRRRGAAGAAAKDLAGTTPADEPVEVTVTGDGRPTVLAFLSSTCHTCSGFWRSLRVSAPAGLPAGTRLVVVTKGPADESAAAIRNLASAEVPVVMSTEAWVDYAVPVTPYFVQVDGPSGRVIGEGSGTTWDQVMSLLNQATADDGAARRQRRGDDEATVDQKLLAAGIRPGDPSLYPSRPATAAEDE